MVKVNKNFLNVIHPYFKNGLWMFDDKKTGLIEEPFISGADDFIEYALKEKDILKGATSFVFIFSKEEFLGFDYHIQKQRLEAGGTIYSVVNSSSFKNAQSKNELWLCGALNLYYGKTPKNIYIQLKSVSNQ